MRILNKMKLSKLGISYYAKKSNDSIVHYNDATYRYLPTYLPTYRPMLHVPIVRNIINILICEQKQNKNDGAYFETDTKLLNVYIMYSCMYISCIPVSSIPCHI